MNKTTKTGDTEKKEVILTETVSSVFLKSIIIILKLYIQMAQKCAN